MNRISGKTALVTGATAGIGEACARAFASFGAKLVIVARRQERLEALREELTREFGGTVRTAALDVRNRHDVERFIAELAADGVVPDILINNAGLARGLAPIHEGDPDDWDEMIDTNLKGLLYVSRAVIPLMVARDRGHVVHIGSVAGHTVYPMGNVYNATKFGVRALTEGMNLDLVGTAIRVSSVDPGLVQTEFSEVRFHGDADRASTVYEGYRPLSGADVADAVCWVVNAPEHVNVHQMTLLPTDQRNPYVLHKRTP
jgi:3-hydroxy acid dehydrogenase / malonic semialdehyde reductase